MLRIAVLTLITESISFISCIFLILFLLELIVITVMAVTGSPAEMFLFFLISHTPFSGIPPQADYEIGTDGLLKVISFWSVGTYICSLVIRKLYKRKLKYVMRFTIISVIILHTLAFIRLGDPDFFITILVFYTFSLISSLSYILLRELSFLISRLFPVNINISMN